MPNRRAASEKPSAERRHHGSTDRGSPVTGRPNLDAVADLLGSLREEVLQRWLEAARGQPFHRDNPEAAIADSMSTLFDALVGLFRRPNSDDAVPHGDLKDAAVLTASRAHAETRVLQGLGVPAIVTEFRLLRQEIGRSLREHHGGNVLASDVVAADIVIEDALDGAVLFALEAVGRLRPGQRRGARWSTPDNELLRLLVERVEDYAMFVLNADGRVATWNSGAERIKGYVAGEILGRPYATFFTPEDIVAGKPERLLRRARIDGRVEDEGWRVRKDGSRFWADAVLTALYDERGRLCGYAKVTRDLTERRRAEEQILLNTSLRELAEARDHALAEAQAERQRFAAIFNQATAGIAQRDLTGRYVLVNGRFRELLGRSTEELLQLKDLDLTHPEDRAHNLQVLERLIEHGEAYTIEKRYMRPDGSTVWAYCSVSLIRDADGAPRHVLSVVADVTEQRQIREALRASEARSVFLAEASRLLAASLDYETTLSNVAQLAVPRVADWCAVDLLDDQGAMRRLAVAHVDPEKARLAHDLERRYPTDRNAGTGVWHVMQTGQAELLHSYMVVPVSVRQRIVGVISFVAAESHRSFGADDLAAAEELARRAAVAIDNARLYQQAQEAIRVRDDFLAAASHDLRNPLGSIRGNAQILERMLERTGSVPMERLRTGLTNIVGATDQMTRLINELLDVARLRLGARLPLERIQADLAELTRRVVAAQQAATEGHHFDVLETEPELIGTWDVARLERVLGNLLSNAVKYSPDGGDIAVRLGRDGDMAVLTVRDFGVGIPAADLQRVFERFERARNVVGRIGGNGIGLTASKHIVEQHGGTIKVDSHEGRGSTFTVRLPLGSQPVPGK